MNIQIVTASAGTGKTTRLAELLDEAVGESSARPEAILATTFTKQAAAELLNRARSRLLQSGHGKEAQALLAARIGTVNSVCGSLVTDFSFELGLSPELRVLDEAGAGLTLKRALASTVTEDDSYRLQSFKGRFDFSFDWHYEVRRLIEAARANGLDADRLDKSAERSVRSLDACLGPADGDAAELDAGLRTAIDQALTAIGANGDTTIGTAKYCTTLKSCRRDLDRGKLRWGDWAKLSGAKPTKKSLDMAVPVQTAAARHLGHPRLRGELHELIRLIFDVAARGMRAYQLLKSEQGLLDFVDQEVYALELLSRPEISAVLEDEIDLVLVDEFQDTSPLQLAIFLELAKLAKRSVWVGDPKQAIYGFRGTDPALMDAAIESLSSPSQDPDLVAAAMSAVAQHSPIETLSRSFRSRPDLVALTNAIFARAFALQQGMPNERVSIEADRNEVAELGPAVNCWPLVGQGRMNKQQLSAAVAAGAQDLLAGSPMIWDRHTDEQRPATTGDLAILCRTNDQCLNVSEALGQLGVPSVVARVGLRDSAEAQVVLAGLRLWVDPQDRLAAATLVRILEYPEQLASVVETVLAPDRDERLQSAPAVRALLQARESAQDADVMTAVDAALDVLDLRGLCAAWGEQDQRTANLDALRAHAVKYCDERTAGGRAPSLVGFLSHFDELAAESGWGTTRSDTIARVGSRDAVTISTWHAAKGLEWPMVVLFGLESVRSPEAYGVHVLTERTEFDVSDPLGGRWIHFWPNPYTTSNQGGPVKTAYRQSDAHRSVAEKNEHEALRVLYVGWTRARDRLILAAQSSKLLSGLLGTLTDIDPGLITEPAAAPDLVDKTWADHSFKLRVDPFQPANPTPAAPESGSIRVGKAPANFAPATLAPSSAPPRPAHLEEPVQLGPPVQVTHRVDTASLGTAVHDFFAADDPERPTQDRLEMATGLLARYRVTGAVEASDLLQMADRLWKWIKEAFGQDCALRTEWPLGQRLAAGTLALGTADLILETPDALAVIDHKSFGFSAAESKAEELGGQLGCYVDALVQARPGKPVSTWVHLPFDGVVVEVTLGAVASADSMTPGVSR